MVEQLLEADRDRALISKGISNNMIYTAIERQLKGRVSNKNGLVVDIGCGRGQLWGALSSHFARYVGVDIVRHPDFPEQQELVLHNLSQPDIPMEDNLAEVAIACEVTPQLENPRLLFRELVRLVKPGGWIVVTNPNLLSALSVLTLLTRQRFNAFQDEAYPLMITPVLEADLLRMARENGLVEPKIFYVCSGRLAFTVQRYPRWLWQRFPRLFSDNLGIIARKPLV